MPWLPGVVVSLPVLSLPVGTLVDGVEGADGVNGRVRTESVVGTDGVNGKVGTPVVGGGTDGEPGAGGMLL
jgi:hypothetical protein